MKYTVLGRAFFILYSILAVCINFFLIPIFLFLAFTKKKYRYAIPARFFSLKNPPLARDGIWFHVCSFGEARAIYPMLDLLPREMLRATAVTQTGYDALSKKLPDQGRFLPFEPWLFYWIQPQKVLVVMEAELWYLLFVLAKKRGAKTLLVNARISDRSFAKYKRASFLYRQIFRYIDEVYAQTERDKVRLELLGAQNVSVTGNIKLFRLPEAKRALKQLRHPLVCAASTHKGEESLIMPAYMKLKSKEVNAQLVIVPRHPERFEEVVQLVALFSQKHGLRYGRYTRGGLGDEDIVVVDTLGELVEIYSISDIVILGGSFVPVGGHNAAEAAQFGCRMISGESWENQRDIYAAVDGIRIVSSDVLGDTLMNYRSLPHTSIKQNVDIEPILYSINQTIKVSQDGTSLQTTGTA